MLRSNIKNIKPIFRYAVVFGMLLILVYAVFFISAQSAFAQTDFEQFGKSTGLSNTSIIVIIARIIRTLIGLIGIVLVILFLYAGFLYMTSKGETAPIEKAKKIFQQSIIGMVIVLSSYSIASFILGKLLAASQGASSSTGTSAVYESVISSLGAGIIESYYPTRNATGIARNTKIFVTFKEEIDPKTIIKDYKDESTFDLNTDSVLIYKTDDKDKKPLASKEVVVYVGKEKGKENRVYIFDPVEYLGNPEKNTDYTVELTPKIQKIKNGKSEPAFVGIYSKGEKWSFEVSTEIDLTSPRVVSFIPQKDSKEARNISVELTFNEVMDPIASTGSYITKEDAFFKNIGVTNKKGDFIEGTYSISNGYKTVTFTTTDACFQDPCGDTIYCLPALEDLTVIARAATLDPNDVPQGKIINGGYDGLVDASGNSLSGLGNAKSCGSELDKIVCEDNDKSEADHYTWKFSTTNEINDTIPKIEEVTPKVKEGLIGVSSEVKITFNTLLKGSTINSTSVSIWPDPLYSMWFTSGKKDTIEKTDVVIIEKTDVVINHPDFISNAEGGYEYWPVITKDVKSAYQICMYPATMKDSCAGMDKDNQYCCNGTAQKTECKIKDEKNQPINLPVKTQ